MPALPCKAMHAYIASVGFVCMNLFIYIYTCAFRHTFGLMCAPVRVYVHHANRMLISLKGRQHPL